MARRSSARIAPSNEVVALNTSRELPSDAERTDEDPRIAALPDSHGHAKGEHKSFAEERPIPYTARMLFLWFFHACRRGRPRFMMVADHINYLTFEDPAAVNLVRRALKLAQAGDLYGAAETAGVEVAHAAVVSEGLRRGMRYSIGAEVDNDPRSRPDAQNIVDAMRPDGMVRSVHFLSIVHPQHGEWMWPYDNPEFVDLFDVVGVERTWELYMATLLDAIDKLPGHIVGHFYAPGKFGHWPDEATLESYEDRFLDACAERGMAVEINARYFYKGGSSVDEASLERYRELHARLLTKAKAKNVAVAVGSDAHSPKDQGRAFDEVLALLDRAEINEIAFPINGRLARVALRATAEIRAVATDSSARAASLAAIPTDDDEDEDAPIAGQAPVASAPAEPQPAPAAATAAPARKRPSRAKPKVDPSAAVTDADARSQPSAARATSDAQSAETSSVDEAPPVEATAAVATSTASPTGENVDATTSPAPTDARADLGPTIASAAEDSSNAADPAAVEPAAVEPLAAEPAVAVPTEVDQPERTPDRSEPIPRRRSARKTTARPTPSPVSASKAPTAKAASEETEAPAATAVPAAEPAPPVEAARPAKAATTAPAPKAAPASKTAPARKATTAAKTASTGKTAPVTKAAPAPKAASTSKTAARASASATKGARSAASTASKPAATKSRAAATTRKAAAPAATAAKRGTKPSSKTTAAKKTARPTTTRAAAKKTAAKAAPVRKAAAKRAPVAKRTAAKRSAVKAPAKKSAAKKTGKARR